MLSWRAGSTDDLPLGSEEALSGTSQLSKMCPSSRSHFVTKNTFLLRVVQEEIPLTQDWDSDPKQEKSEGSEYPRADIPIPSATSRAVSCTNPRALSTGWFSKDTDEKESEVKNDAHEKLHENRRSSVGCSRSEFDVSTLPVELRPRPRNDHL